MRVSRQARLRIHRPGGRRPGGGPGFTLAEILVAVGVLLVAFLGVITVYLVGYGDVSQGGKDMVGAMAAQSLVEGLRNLPRNIQLPLTLQGMNNVTTTNPSTCPPVNPPVYPQALNALCTAWVTQVTQLPQGQGTVTVVQTTPIPGGVTFSAITVSVSWVEPGRGSRALVVVAGRAGGSD